MKKLVPIGDRVLVRVSRVTETKGGIVIPQLHDQRGDATQKTDNGTVVAVGPGRLCEDGSYAPMECKIGDEVVFGQYAGTEITGWAEGDVKTELLLMMREGELLARIPLTD